MEGRAGRGRRKGVTREGRPLGLAGERQGESSTGARGPEQRQERSQSNRSPVMLCRACLKGGAYKKTKTQNQQSKDAG